MTPELSTLAVSSETRIRPFRTLVFAGLLCGVWVALWWLAQSSANRIPRPFVFWDVAIVSVLCGLPVGLVVADRLLNVSRMLGMLLAAMGLALGTLLFFDLPGLASLGPSWLGRWLWGGGIGASSAILAGGLNLSKGSPKTANWPLWSLWILVPLLSAASFTYAADRARHHEKTIQKYLSQSRWQEARQLVLKLHALDPGRKLNGESLAEIAAGLNQQIKFLRQEVLALEEDLAKAKDETIRRDLRIRLGEDFAMLGATDEATKALLPLVEKDSPSPIALNLLGTILEHQERWSESLAYYEQARDELLKASSSPQQKAELVRAWKGIAYAHRNQNRHLSAEAAYRNVITLEPSAANHYLLAQFYENAQEGDKAQKHAYLAAEQDPGYRERADQLVTGLQGNQFGCFGVFQNRRNLLSR